MTLPSGIPIPDPLLDFHEQPELVLLAQVIWGESRNQVDMARVGVGWVVRNRVTHRRGFGIGYHDVITQENAFSALRLDDPNRKKMMVPTFGGGAFAIAVWENCFRIAQAVYNKTVPDPTYGATFYYSPPVKFPPKDWGDVEFTIQLGVLRFYRQVVPPVSPKLVAA